MTITLALDWTPNTLHAGILAAEAKGWFEEVGIHLNLISPRSDDYFRTPARKLAEGDVDLAIAPSESVLSYRTSRNPVPLVAVAALAQRDTSAIVVLADSDIERPQQLDGKRYASYNARFEDDIVRAMVQNDGGRGVLNIVTPPKLGIWSTLVSRKAEATWVFMPWEGVEAARNQVQLRPFYLGDYGIPYGYTPVLLGHEERLGALPMANFLKACQRGHQYAAEQPEACAAEILPYLELPPGEELAFVEQSLRELAPAWLNPSGQWGTMEAQRWEAFTQWLADQQIFVPKSLRPREVADSLFTNRFF